MKIEEILKINYKLGSNFILFPNVNDGWTLARSGSYRPIMNSNENTKEELYEFVKEHREYNSLAIVRRFGIIANVIVLISCVVNLYLHSTELSFTNFGALLILLPMLIITSYIGASNHDLLGKVLEEDIKYYEKISQEKVKEMKSTKTKRVKKSSEIQK